MREATLGAGNLHRVLDVVLGNVLLRQFLGDFLGIRTEPRVHCLLEHLGEAVAAGVPLRRPVDLPPNLQQTIPDVGRVLASKLDDLHRVPHEMIRTDLLKPERLHAE